MIDIYFFTLINKDIIQYSFIFLLDVLSVNKIYYSLLY